MRITTQWLFLAIMMCTGCPKDAPTSGADTGASATPSVAPSQNVAAPSASASASAAPEVQHDCPPNSTGLGAFAKPCESKGAVRMIEIAWNGKNDDSGSPFFKVASKAPKQILYGRVAVYFYDKAGKQIDVKEPVEGSDKTHAFHVCSGALFPGMLNAGEKATYNFSCVKKSHVPDGAAAIEAEAQIVGFADATGKKNEFYWKNTDLTPEARPKGGVK